MLRPGWRRRDFDLFSEEDRTANAIIVRKFYQRRMTQAEDIVTMDNGCVCCTVRGDLVKALLNFLDRRHTFDCILLETTGIADPSPIVATFNQVWGFCFAHCFCEDCALVVCSLLLFLLISLFFFR